MTRWDMKAILGKASKACTRDDRGAVSVDWVVISAAVIIFGLLVWTIVQGGVLEGSSQIREAILSANDKF